MKKLGLACLLLFAIVAICQSQTITVTSPNGGENWPLGSTHAITWRSSGLTGNVTILLFSRGDRVGVIQDNVPVAAGSFSWVAGSYQGGTAAPGTNYKVRIRKPQTEILDSSDRPFTISGVAAPTSITVTSPNGGENWFLRTPGSNNATVTWSCQGISGDVFVILKKGETPVRSQTALNIGSSSFSYENVEAGDNYKIRVENVDHSVADESDGNFSIKRETVRMAEPTPTHARGPRITSFRINNGAELTTNRTVTLSNTVLGSPTHYRVEKRRTRTLYWTEWLPYSAEPTTDLLGDCGEISLRLQVKDATGESEPVADSIIYSFDSEQTMPAGCIGPCPCPTRGGSGWNRYRIIESTWTWREQGEPIICRDPDSEGNYHTIGINVPSSIVYGQKIVIEFFGHSLKSTTEARKGPIIFAGCPSLEAGIFALKSASGRA
jgi:hypothetical protein